MKKLLLLTLLLPAFAYSQKGNLFVTVDQNFVHWPGFTDFAKSNFKYTTFSNPLGVQRLTNFSGNFNLGFGFKKKKFGFGIKFGGGAGSANRIITEYFVPTTDPNQPLKEISMRNIVYLPNQYYSASNSFFVEYQIERFLFSFDFISDWSGLQHKGQKWQLTFSPSDNVVKYQPGYTYPGNSPFNTFFLSGAIKFGLILDKQQTAVFHIGITGRKFFLPSDRRYIPFRIEYEDGALKKLGYSEFRESFTGLGFLVGIEKRFYLRQK